MNKESHYVEEDMVEIDLREYLNILWQKKWIIITLFLIAVISSFFISKSMTKIYQTESLLMVEEQDTEDLFSEQLSLNSNNQDKIATYSEIIKSRRILKNVIKSLELKNEENDEYISVNSLRNKISINRTGESDLMRLSVTYSNPETAKEIANKTIEIFKDENLKINQTDLQGASDFITNQLEDTKKQLSTLEKDLLKYQQENEVYYPEEQGKKFLEQLTSLEKGLAEANIEINQTKASLKEVNNKLSNEDERVISSKTITRNPTINELKNKLTTLETDISAKREIYTDKHPEVQTLNARITSIEEKLNDQVEEIVSSKVENINPLYSSLEEQKIDLESQIIAAEAKKESFNKRINDLESELSKIPEKELSLARLQREKTITEDIYLMLMQRQEEIQIQKSMQTSDIVIIDSAITNEKPIKPNIKLNVAIAGVLGLMAAVFIIFLLEFLDNTIKGENDVEKITSVPVLGVIPKFDEINHKQGYGRNGDN